MLSLIFFNINFSSGVEKCAKPASPVVVEQAVAFAIY